MSVGLEAISKSFGGPDVLREVELAADDGELLCVVGPSGSGKTTLLRIVAGLERPDAGRVFIGGRDVTRVPPAGRGVGMVFQSYALLPHLTAGENLGFGLKLRRAPGRAERVAAVAERLGLTALLGRRPADLSGGERQRVALGRALLRDPQVLLCDEPLSSLDVRLRARTREGIRDVQRESGVTMLYVTHDLDEAFVLGDRVAVLCDGQVVQVGTPAEIYERPQSVFVATFSGRDGMNVLPDGYDGSLGFRPEHAELGAPRAGDLSVEGAVVRTEYRGTDALVIVSTPRGDVAAHLDASEPETGSAVTVRVPEGRLHRFDRDGFRR